MKNKLISFTAYLIIADVFFQILIVEAQLMLSGQLLITNRMILAVILFLIALNFLLLPVNKNLRKFKSIITVLLLETAVLLPVISLINTGSLQNWFYIASRDRLFLVFTLFFIVFREQLDFRKILAAIFLIAVINCIICVIQYQFNSVLYTYFYYPDGEGIFNGLNFIPSPNHQFRSVGTLSSGYECGTLLNFALVYALYQLEKQKRTVWKAVYFGVILLLLFGIYTTFTRNIYLMTIYLVGMYVFLRLPFPKKFKSVVCKFLPIAFFSLFCIGFAISSDIQIGATPMGILSTLSLSMRMDEWAEAFRTFTADPTRLVIGFAQSQNTGIINDNIYINTVYSSGLIGLALYGYYWLTLTHRLYRTADHHKLFLCFFVYTSSIFAVGIGNILSSGYALLAFSIPHAMLMKEA